MEGQGSCAEQTRAPWYDAPGSECEAEWCQIHTSSDLSSSPTSSSGRGGSKGQQQRAAARLVRREVPARASNKASAEDLKELQSLIQDEAMNLRKALASKASLDQAQELKSWAAAQGAGNAATTTVPQEVMHMRWEWRAGMVLIVALQIYSMRVGAVAPDAMGIGARATPAVTEPLEPSVGTEHLRESIQSKASCTQVAVIEASLAELWAGTERLQDSVLRKADVTQVTPVEAAVLELQVQMKKLDGKLQGKASLGQVTSLEATLSEVQAQVEKLSRNIQSMKAEAGAQMHGSEGQLRVTPGVQNALQVQRIAKDPAVLAGRHVAFFNRFHNHFVRMRGDGKIDASGPKDVGRVPGAWGRFAVVAAAGGGIALHNTFHDRFVNLGGDADALVLTTSKITAWDPMHAAQRWPSVCFTMVDVALGDIALHNEYRRRFVGMRHAEEMDANSTTIGPSERFSLVVLEE